MNESFTISFIAFLSTIIGILGAALLIFGRTTSAQAVILVGISLRLAAIYYRLERVDITIWKGDQ